HGPGRLLEPWPVGPRGRLRGHQGQGLALRHRPPQGDRPVRGPAGRDLEASGARLLAVLRSSTGVGGPVPGEGVERRARALRPDAAPLNLGENRRCSTPVGGWSATTFTTRRGSVAAPRFWRARANGCNIRF